MRPLWHDPLSMFYGPGLSTFGWLLAMVATSLLGLWLGLWVASGEPPSIHWITGGVTVVVLAPLLFPWLVVLYGFTLLLCYLPRRFEPFESAGLQLVAAMANLLAWLACWAIVGFAYPWWFPK
jgi:hypothetical protein